MPDIFPMMKELWSSDYKDGSNRYWVFQAASIPFLYSLLYIKSKFKFILLSFYFLLVIFANGRMEVIVLITWIILYFYMTDKERGKRKKTYLIYKFSIIIIIISFIGFANYLKSEKNISSSFLRYQVFLNNPEVAAGSRFFYWETTIYEIIKRPFLGNIIRNNKKMENSGYNLVERSAYSGRSHNNYLAVTYAYGILGLLLYIILITVLFKSLFNARYYLNNQDFLFILLIIVRNVLSGFTVGDYFNFVSSPVIVALVAYINIIIKRKKNEKESLANSIP